jgi:RimJ/RimL family protein N-acetyltransferase/catechol 2,3-dioxygenase-like lactoylglutathione lyase family enzyme
MTAVLSLEHVQLDIPPGGEEIARAFYADVLALPVMTKPASLNPRGAWFHTGTGELHLSVVPDARPAVKGHAAIRVRGLDALAARCEAAGHAVEHDHRYPGRNRFYVRDPFGNRIELFQLDEDATPNRRSEQPTLETPRLWLRPFRPGDAPDVQMLAGAAEVADTTLSIPHPYPPDAAEAWIATHPPQWEEGTLAAFAIVERDTDSLVGAIGLVIIPPHACAEVGYWIGKPHWGRGFATEAGRALFDFAFGPLELHRIEGRHFTRNAPSGRVMQKLGMEFECVQRESLRKHGRFEDVARYAILAPAE